MMGWILMFALLLLCGALAAVGDLRAPGITSCMVFGFLLAIFGLSLLLRGRA